MIKGSDTLQELNDFAVEYAKKLRKFIVHSNDIAGFIGNGHFMRDALLGISFVDEFKSNYGFPEAVYLVNKVSQDLLVRPMGIFQLVDYVGIDVCKFIMEVMNPYFNNENIHSNMLDQLFERGVKGGQFSNGSQKNGFMKYEKGRITQIYDFYNNQYVDYEEVAKQAARLKPYGRVEVNISTLAEKGFHEIQVEMICDSSSSFSDIITFKTLGCCEFPSGLDAITLSDTSADLSWNSVFAANEYIINYMDFLWRRTVLLESISRI